MYRFDVVEIGVLLLVGYIIYHLIERGTGNLLRRIIFYSFIFYAVNVFQLTTGGINIPPQTNHWEPSFQLIPFKFVGDWVALYQRRGLDWFFGTHLNYRLITC